jgi:hypothetical protein
MIENKVHEILRRIIERSEQGMVRWLEDAQSENTYYVRFDSDTQLRVCFESPPSAPDHIEITLNVEKRNVMKLSAEEGDTDWGLLKELSDEARRWVLKWDAALKTIDEALQQEGIVGWPAEDRDAAERLILREGFPHFQDWEQYLEGQVSPTEQPTRSPGHTALAKTAHNDPHGGFRKVGRPVEGGLCLSGWLLSPRERAGGKANRIAIEDSDFNGYGFSITHDTKRIGFEKRTRGKAKGLGKGEQFDAPQGEWYQFKFFVAVQGQLRLEVRKQNQERPKTLTAEWDEQFRSFDRIAVHGGHDYYLAELVLERA